MVALSPSLYSWCWCSVEEMSPQLVSGAVSRSLTWVWTLLTHWMFHWWACACVCVCVRDVCVCVRVHVSVCASVWVSVRVSGWVCKWVSVQVSEYVSEWVCKWVSKWVSKWVCKWVCEWVGEWVCKWVSEWVCEWASEWERVKVMITINVRFTDTHISEMNNVYQACCVYIKMTKVGSVACCLTEYVYCCAIHVLCSEHVNQQLTTRVCRAMNGVRLSVIREGATVRFLSGMS